MCSLKLGIVLAAGLSSCLGSILDNSLVHKESLNIVMHSGIGGRSHIKEALEMGQILIERGHSVEYAAFEHSVKFAKGYNVTTYTLGPDPLPPNFVHKQIMNQLSDSKQKQPSLISPSFIKVMQQSYEKTFEPLSNYLDTKKPDLLLCDFGVEACSDIAKIKGIPLIVYIQTTDIFGLLSAPYITKGMDYGALTIENLSFKERFSCSIFDPLTNFYQILTFLKYKRELKQKYKIIKSNSMFASLDYGIGIANTFTGFEVPTPIKPNVFQVGPILSSSSDKLDSELNQFLNHHNKTIYVAFGSNVKLPVEDITKLIKAAIISLNEGTINGLVWGLGLTNINDFPKEIEVDSSKIDIRDIFKGKFEGVKLLNWAPQQAILNHPNTKLFVSHGGMESSLEGIHSATPILCIPYFGDQPRNAAKLESLGIGQYINRFKSSASSIAKSINHIIKDESGLFQTHVNRMKVISSYNSKRVNSAVDIIESHGYIAKACRPGLPFDPNDRFPPYESNHLITADTRMSWVKSNLADVYLTALVIGLLIAGLTVYILFKIVLSVYKKLIKSKPFSHKTKES